MSRLLLSAARLSGPSGCAAVALACVLAFSGPLPVAAESLATSASSAGSSASSAGSASSRGSSDSIRMSSDSSRDEPAKVAEGEYRIIEVRAARQGGTDQGAEIVTLTVVPTDAGAGAAGFELDLPRTALGEAPLAAGDRIAARHRPYGLEFARVDTREAFFLVLAEAWQADLQTRIVRP